MRGFQLIHKNDLLDILVSILVTNRVTAGNADYQAGFIAAILTIAASIGKGEEILRRTNELAS